MVGWYQPSHEIQQLPTKMLALISAPGLSVALWRILSLSTDYGRYKGFQTTTTSA